MKDFIKTCSRTIGIVIAAICIGTVLMILAYLLPVDKMRENAKESIDMQLEEGDYYKWIGKDITSQSDGYTDSLMINTATYDGGELSVIERALLNPSATYDVNSRTEMLYNSLQGVENAVETTYGRYWHGYAVILKPLLLLFNYNSIRWLNTFVSCILIAIILLGFVKKYGGHKYATSFLCAVLFLNPVLVRASLQFSAVFYVIMLEYIVALYWGDRLEEKGCFKYLFLTSGIITAFIDLLTYPIAAMGMLLILQFLLFESTLKSDILRAVKSGIMWLVGYLGMWSGKWIMASLLTSENIIGNALSQAVVRSGTSSGVEGWEFSWIGLFKGNFGWILRENAIIFKMSLIVIFAAIIALLICKKATIKLNKEFLVMMFIFCLIPIGRYVVVSNHSFTHSFITHRECVVAVMAGMCAILNSIDIKDSL